MNSSFEESTTSNILPPDQDTFLLQQLGRADREGEDLDWAGARVMEHLGWTLHQYGKSLKRLVDQRWISAILQQNGAGEYLVASPDEVTALGWNQIRHLENQEDPAPKDLL